MKASMMAIVLFTSSMVFAQVEQGKVMAVAAIDKTENAQVSEKAARAPYYLIFHEHGKLMEVVANPFHDVSRGAGPKVVSFLAKQNVSVVIAGDFGHKIATSLHEQGINYYEATGMVKKAVQEFIRQDPSKR
ncbi:MAG: NifB/NifX family molybdenum-iron cluster-binding protein [Thermodesulfobacteriota bacterium]|nr:NifB/NifX family molybdenum-iron cluster-binding protein [Thermodesulfobacteriota bacterium]